MSDTDNEDNPVLFEAKQGDSADAGELIRVILAKDDWSNRHGTVEYYVKSRVMAGGLDSDGEPLYVEVSHIESRDLDDAITDFWNAVHGIENQFEDGSSFDNPSWWNVFRVPPKTKPEHENEG